MIGCIIAVLTGFIAGLMLAGISIRQTMARLENTVERIERRATRPSLRRILTQPPTTAPSHD